MTFSGGKEKEGKARRKDAEHFPPRAQVQEGQAASRARGTGLPRRTARGRGVALIFSRVDEDDNDSDDDVLPERRPLHGGKSFPE